MVVMRETLAMNPAEEVSSQEVTFVQAIRDKYVYQEELNDILVLPKGSLCPKILDTDITLVGFGKTSAIQRQLKLLRSIDVSGKDIKKAGPIEVLDGTLNSIQIVNLGGNSLDWNETTKILKCMPNAQEVILSGNRLDRNLSISELPSKKLKSITLGHSHLNWSTVVDVLSSIWTHVEQLDLWSNDLSEASMTIVSNPRCDLFTNNIRILRLKENKFADFDWISKMGPIRSLIELDLSHCKITSIQIDSSIAEQLANLKNLNISYNNINEWQSISNLHWLRRLENLICKGNPFYSSEKFAKQFVIGRLRGLKNLNREEVTRTIRRDAELLYLRKTFTDYEMFKDGKLQDFKTSHPRYDELIELYGLPEDLTKKQADDRYVVVDLCLNDKKLTKKLPCDMRICNVHMLCKRLFRLKPSSRIRITCHADRAGESSISYVLDKDIQTLDFFSVKNGSQLIIEELG